VAPEPETVPGAQVAQLPEPGNGAEVPAGQAMHASVPVAPIAGENVPAGHGVQSVEPSAVEYVPAGHSLQNAEPGAGENSPSEQMEQ
jgi:hypothetical protein